MQVPRIEGMTLNPEGLSAQPPTNPKLPSMGVTGSIANPRPLGVNPPLLNGFTNLSLTCHSPHSLHNPVSLPGSSEICSLPSLWVRRVSISLSSFFLSSLDFTERSPPFHLSEPSRNQELPFLVLEKSRLISLSHKSFPAQLVKDIHSPYTW
jgi:hypothetical protein